MTPGVKSDKITPMPIFSDSLSRILSDVRTEPLESRHLPDAADLHSRLLHWSLNGRLGPAHIRELYEALYRSPGFFGFACYQDGRLLGFTTATTASGEARRAVLEVYKRRPLAVAALMLKNPLFLASACESKFLVPRLYRRYGTTGEWLTLLTDTDRSYISPFVAMKLIAAVKARYAESGFRCYMAQGVKDNPRAVRTYEKLRWTVVSRLLVHNVYRFDCR